MSSTGREESIRPADSRWPTVVGTIGVIVGIVTIIDRLDDLLLLPMLRPGGLARRVLGERVAEFVSRQEPWIVATSVLGTALGCLLVVGALRLRRRRRSGVSLCRTWSWLAIGWGTVEIVRSLSWLKRYEAELAEISDAAWQGPAAIGLVTAAILMFTFPVFLLLWLAGRERQAEVAGWPE